MEIMEVIDDQVKGNPIIIYMKGSPEAPACGFSARAAQALSACEVPYAYVNILENPAIMQNLPAYGNWPTFPQIYIDGELFGGGDIVIETYQAGDLQKMMSDAVAKAESAKDA